MVGLFCAMHKAGYGRRVREPEVTTGTSRRPETARKPIKTASLQVLDFQWKFGNSSEAVRRSTVSFENLEDK